MKDRLRQVTNSIYTSMYTHVHVHMYERPKTRRDQHPPPTPINPHPQTQQVQSNDVEAIVTLFVVSAPKFISPATDYEAMLAQRSGGAPRPAAASTYGGLQRIVFGEEVRQMLELRKLRDYLKLYSTIGLDKLSAFTVGTGVRCLRCCVVVGCADVL